MIKVDILICLVIAVGIILWWMRKNDDNGPYGFK